MTDLSERAILKAAMRSNLYFFLQRSFSTLHPGEPLLLNWHLEAMCWQLQRLADGEITRLLITVPPRHLKSITTAVAFPAFMLGRDPSLKFMVASYGADLARKHSSDFRLVLQAPWYKKLFKRVRIDSRHNRSDEIMTTHRGGRKAVSLGGPATGFGADILIVDDLMKAVDVQSPIERQRAKDYFDQTLLSRLDNKQTGRIVAIQQRLHEDDIAAYLIDKGNYTHLNLPAIAEEPEEHELFNGRSHTCQPGDVLFAAREPQDVLEQLRRDMGAYAFSSQYQQNPVAPEGNIVRREWFHTYDEAPERIDLGTVVLSFDIALSQEPSADFSVGTVWGYRRGKWYLLDVWRGKLEAPQLKARMLAMVKEWNPSEVIIEDVGNGKAIYQDIRAAMYEEGYDPPIGWKPRDDKETRLRAQAIKIESGDILFPKQAPWLANFHHELMIFPHGRNDDQVDSMTQFLEWSGSDRAWEATAPRDPRTGRLFSPRRQQRPNRCRGF